MVETGSIRTAIHASCQVKFSGDLTEGAGLALGWFPLSEAAMTLGRVLRCNLPRASFFVGNIHGYRSRAAPDSACHKVHLQQGASARGLEGFEFLSQGRKLRGVGIDADPSFLLVR